MFHIGGYKKKYSRKASFSQKTGDSPWHSKLQLRSKLTKRKYLNQQYNLFSVGLRCTSGQKTLLKGTTPAIEYGNQRKQLLLQARRSEGVSLNPGCEGTAFLRSFTSQKIHDTEVCATCLQRSCTLESIQQVPGKAFLNRMGKWDS